MLVVISAYGTLGFDVLLLLVMVLSRALDIRQPILFVGIPCGIRYPYHIRPMDDKCIILDDTENLNKYMNTVSETYPYGWIVVQNLLICDFGTTYPMIIVINQGRNFYFSYPLVISNIFHMICIVMGDSRVISLPLNLIYNFMKCDDTKN